MIVCSACACISCAQRLPIGVATIPPTPSIVKPNTITCPLTLSSISLASIFVNFVLSSSINCIV